ncbi:hypothetical protein Daura_28600 [Dactylosporangium aurantiacum]|uniref:Uncharacterized protein n=1 Tax=Dactylosporangium aurantiacum TaxID=35754 RepID=A0A9Q9ICP2_9ACTN|nr:hypothetical protein [Dactylosporangium aurantiacum]MDG6106612.1 hypothetical protein [Dactylosporangium aurantiacum]UWZ50773.1 hypothetical protein Daura_28600 [Dactylosporangium aurantiacum]
MTAVSAGRSRREALDLARQSRRPSRLGGPAGAAPGPDHHRSGDAGFVTLLRQVWRSAAQAPDLHQAVDTMLTLDGHVPAEVPLRALATPAACAVAALWGASWQGEHRCRELPTAGRTAYTGEVGLGTDGRLLIRTPGEPPLDPAALVGRPRRVPWSRMALERYHTTLAQARLRAEEAAADCRRWLVEQGEEGRAAILDRLEQATLRTAPFILYQEGRQYTNFRDRNTIVGKTLWPGHPDCAYTALRYLPPDLWPTQDVLMVVCLTLLVRSGSPGRIEEANGTELNLDNIGDLLERVRRTYERVGAGTPVAAAPDTRVASLDTLAGELAAQRAAVAGQAQLYREIHGALLHKVERVAAAPGPEAWAREAALVERLLERLPVHGGTLATLGDALEADPSWLTRPHGGFGTGLESLVYETVRAATGVFGADFAMSRGMRRLGALIEAMRGQEWQRIVGWELPEYFCCVVPAADADRHFPGGPAKVADLAWAMSSRMQYNSWHFVPGNLPPEAAALRRDYFVPPTMPDIAHFSDQHHHGHVTARVRFTVRSPQPVEILGRQFKGFIDLRLLRCDGAPFEEADLLAAHQASRFIARATGLAADLAAAGDRFAVTAFDSRWHWTTILAAAATGSRR